MERVEFLTDYFNTNWRKHIKDVSDSRLVADHKPLIEPIANMKLSVEPTSDKKIAVNGWRYVGPGNLVLDIYLDIEYILNYPIDHLMVANMFFAPWLKSIVKYFSINIFEDFADFTINFYDRNGYADTFKFDFRETNTNNFYFNKPKYWEKID